MIKNFLLRALLICWGVFLASILSVYAQEPDETKEPIIVNPSGRLNLTFKQLGSETRSLSEEQTHQFYQVYLPGNFKVSPTNNYLDLISSHIPPVPERNSVMQIMINGELFSSVVLTETNAVSNTLRLDLPEGQPKIGRNSIAISLDTGATCEDSGGFLNVFIDENSTLSFQYEQIPYPADLGLYPFPFTEESLLDIPVTIILPDQPTSTDLSAAATIAAGLGQRSEGSINLTAVQASNLTPDIQNNHHLIVIGQRETNNLLSNLDLPLPLDEITLKSGQGMLQEIISPWNEFRLVLVVSSLDDEGLLKASNALNRQVHFLSMRGPVAVVVELGSLSNSDEPPTPSFTLDSLDYETQVIYGTGPKDYRYDFNLPLGWQLEEDPFFVFKFAHADILSPESTLDIKLNGVPIGSTLLDNTNTDEGELTVSLPNRLLKTGRNRLEVGVDMMLPNTSLCDGLDDKRAWTIINNESEIFLPYRTSSLLPDLGLFPYPFSQISELEQSVFIFPDQPSSDTFNELIQLAVRLGSATRSKELAVRVKFASEVDQNIRQNHHLVLLGRPTKNSLLAEINTFLPQPFVIGSDLLEPLVIDSVAYLPDPNRDAGLLEIIESPWNKQFNILVITGTTDEGVKLAARALLKQTDELEGNLGVVEPNLNPFADDSEQLNTYSIDTRSLPAVNREASSTSSAPLSLEEQSALTNRWWK